MWRLDGIGVRRALLPPPPEESKHKEVRYYHVHEGEEIDEKQLGKWVRDASAMEGERV